jgi:hypothetical protein
MEWEVKAIPGVFLLLFLPLLAMAENNSMPLEKTILKISVLSTNSVLLNGKEVGPDELSEALSEAEKLNGVVWYYRENPGGEPPPAASQVIQMVIDKKLPISISTKPDFSDYVDENGNAKIRK